MPHLIHVFPKQFHHPVLSSFKSCTTSRNLTGWYPCRSCWWQGLKYLNSPAYIELVSRNALFDVRKLCLWLISSALSGEVCVEFLKNWKPTPWSRFCLEDLMVSQIFKENIRLQWSLNVQCFLCKITPIFYRTEPYEASTQLRIMCLGKLSELYCNRSVDLHTTYFLIKFRTHSPETHAFMYPSNSTPLV